MPIAKGHWSGLDGCWRGLAKGGPQTGPGCPHWCALEGGWVQNSCCLWAMSHPEESVFLHVLEDYDTEVPATARLQKVKGDVLMSTLLQATSLTSRAGSGQWLGQAEG